MMFLLVPVWIVLCLSFVWLVDPYGVSPVLVDLPHVNRHKPKRIDIDRLIKPYEVWLHQPATVFLGTSRIHQSIDPAILDGTELAPGYNGSIPASSLSLNVAHLRQYLELAPGLHHVYAELFLYNFLGQPQPPVNKTWSGFVLDSLGLHVSADAVWAGVLTIAYNFLVNTPPVQVKPGGYFSYRPGHDARVSFDGFAAGIWKQHETRTGGLQIHEPAMQAFRDLIRVATERGVSIRFLYTPNHAYDDYYIEAVGGWSAVENLLTRVSSEAEIYSFAQPNAFVYEEVSRRMTYWYDPYHFSLEMGRAIQDTLLGRSRPDLPSNFMVRLTPDVVPRLVRDRREAIRSWADRHPDFVARFNAERQSWTSRSGRGPVPGGG